VISLMLCGEIEENAWKRVFVPRTRRRGGRFGYKYATVIRISVMTISAKGEVLTSFQTCCAVTNLCRIRDFSCLLHAAHVETKDMKMVVSVTLVRATFLPKVKMW